LAELIVGHTLFQL